MKNKKMFNGILCMLLLFILTGCFNKSTITTDQFKKEAESFGLNTVDVTSQFSQNKEILEATVAGKTNEWQIEFYVLEDRIAATNMFNTNKRNFEEYKTTSSKEISNIFNKSYTPFCCMITYPFLIITFYISA